MLYIWSVIGGQNSGLKSAWWKPHKWCLPGQCCEVLWGKFKGQYLQSVESWFVKLLMAKLFPFNAHSPPPLLYNYFSKSTSYGNVLIAFFYQIIQFLYLCAILSRAKLFVNQWGVDFSNHFSNLISGYFYFCFNLKCLKTMDIWGNHHVWTD